MLSTIGSLSPARKTELGFYLLFRQGWRDIEAVNGASRRRPAQDLQRRPAAAASDIGDPTRRVEMQSTDQRFVDRRHHRFHASELRTPFLATRGGPVGSRGVLVHESEFTASTVLTVSVVFRELAKSTVEPH